MVGVFARIVRSVPRHPASLLLIVLAAWSSTVPIGVGPDSTFHLASTWCASGVSEGLCEPGSTEITRRVPADVLGQCSLLGPTGVCLATESSEKGSAKVETGLVNIYGTYIGVFYRLNSFLITSNPEISLLAMRLVNIGVFVLVLSAALTLASPRARRALVIAFGMTSTAFLWLVVTHTNQSWTVTGLTGFWMFALVFGETQGWNELRRRLATAGMIGCIFLVASSRTDGIALLIITAMICAFVVLEGRGVPIGRLFAIAGGIGFVGLLLLRFVVSPSYFRYFLAVFTGQTDLLSKYDFPLGDLVFHNVHHSAEFVMLSLSGGYATPGDPLAVGPTIFLVAIGLGGLVFLLAGRPTRTFLVAIAGVFAALFVYPVLATVRNGQTFIQEFIPRYLAPFAVPAVGLLLVLAPGAARLDDLSASSRRLLVGLIAVAHASALHIAMRTAVSGDNLGISTWNLNEWVLWWWSIGPSPMTMWMLGSIALPVFVNTQLKRPLDA